MSHSSEESPLTDDVWKDWITGVRQGDDTAVLEMWDRYGLPLLRLADHNLQERLRRRVDPEDVVQSAFRTVLRRLQGGEFQLTDDSQLWKLLCAVTLNKSRRQARLHNQQKRSMDREVYFQDANEGPLGVSPTPGEAAMLVDLVEHVVSTSGDEEERSVLLLKLDDRSNSEVAEKLKISERTVRRILSRVRSRVELLLEV